MTDVMCRTFNKKVKALMENKRHNSCYLTKQKYSSLIKAVKIAKSKEKGKQPSEYRLLKRYDVIKESGHERLISPINYYNPVMKHYVWSDELFNVIHMAHVKIGHGGRTKMVKELNKTYKNVTLESIMLYMDLCEVCKKKNRMQEKGIFASTLSKEMNSRCQIDIIDMQAQADKEYRFILKYQNYITNFIILRALKSDSVEEIANNLVDVFTTFGTPLILQSSYGQQFASKVVEHIFKLWAELRIVIGEAKQSDAATQAVEDENECIKRSVITWMQDHSTDKWTTGLCFVQFAKNNAYHRGIKCSPFEATFGYPAKIGLKSYNLPENIKTEDELEEVTGLPRPSDGKHLKVEEGEEPIEDMDNEEIENYDDEIKIETEDWETEMVEVVLDEPIEGEVKIGTDNMSDDENFSEEHNSSPKYIESSNKNSDNLDLHLKVSKRQQLIKERRRIACI